MENVLLLILEKIKQRYIPSDQELQKITLESCKIKDQGDLTTNAFMILRQHLTPETMDHIQQTLQESLPIESIKRAGPGFLNIKFKPIFWQQLLLKECTIPNIGHQQKVLLEFLSTNPTGPIHVGHARNAILGDVLARILMATGFEVIKEYYVNDAGGQIDHLAESLKLRYEETQGKKITLDDFKDDMYPGEYLIDVAQQIKTIPKDFKAYAVDAMLGLIKEDLKKLDIHFDVFTSEKELIEKGKVQAAFEALKQSGDMKESVLEKPKDFDGHWEARKQWVFESTKYGDNQDRAFTKSDGSWTYFASDVAYHYDKYKRGFTTLIDVLGADHIGYIKRIEAAVEALSKGQCHLSIMVCQLVKFMKNGEPLKMSKRANTFITMRDVVDEIGADALRFLLLMRRHDMGYDFDLEKAIEKTKDNPVFYVQYATARIGSLMRRFKGHYDTSCVNFLIDPAEIDLIKVLAEFPKIVTMAAKDYEPHRIANYLYHLASEFHSLWSKDGYRFIVENQENHSSFSSGRMILAKQVLIVLEKGLHLLGVNAPLEM